MYKRGNILLAAGVVGVFLLALAGLKFMQGSITGFAVLSENLGKNLTFIDGGTEVVRFNVSNRAYSSAYIEISSDMPNASIDILQDGMNDWDGVSAFSSNFVDRLNSKLANCSDPCTISAEVSGSGNGSVYLGNLLLEYAESSPGLGILPVLNSSNSSMNSSVNITLPADNSSNLSNNASLSNSSSNLSTEPSLGILPVVPNTPNGSSNISLISNNSVNLTQNISINASLNNISLDLPTNSSMNINSSLNLTGNASLNTTTNSSLDLTGMRLSAGMTLVDRGIRFDDCGVIMGKKDNTLAGKMRCQIPSMGLGIASAGSSSRVFDCGNQVIESGPNSVGLEILSGNLNLKNCILRGNNIGISVASNVKGLVLENMVVKGNRVGASVKDSPITLRNIRFEGNSEVGLEINNSPGSVLEGLVANNTKVGFRIVDSSPIKINVTAFNASLYGVEFIEGGHAIRMLSPR